MKRKEKPERNEQEKNYLLLTPRSDKRKKKGGFLDVNLRLATPVNVPEIEKILQEKKNKIRQK